MWQFDLPIEISDLFENSSITIDLSGNREFLIGFEPSEDLKFLQYLIDFDINFMGQIVINQDLLTLSFQIQFNNDSDNSNFFTNMIFTGSREFGQIKVDIQLTQNEMYNIIRNLYDLNYHIYNVFNQKILFSHHSLEI